jgi:hypothetical protein
MAISYVLDRTRREMRTKVEGQVTASDILDHLNALCREEALEYLELIDARHTARPFMSPTEVWRAAIAVLSTKVPKPIAPRAIILHDDVTFGLARIFTNIVSGRIPVQAFRDEAKAEEWLAGWSPPPETKG